MRLALFLILAPLQLAVAQMPSFVDVPQDPERVISRDVNEYFVWTGDVRTTSWTEVEATDFYEYEVWHVETQEKIYEGSVPASDQLALNSFQWTPVRVGHWAVRLRACNAEGCSDWSDCTDENQATVGGLARGWLVFAWIAPPTF